jgi:hypothetical protein
MVGLTRVSSSVLQSFSVVYCTSVRVLLQVLGAQ